MAKQEKLIINGVDVTGCRFSELLYGAVCCNKSGLHGACNDNPECEYKQLERLEQENKELKKLLIQMGCPTIATAKRTVLNLKQEVERKSDVILKYIVKYDALISSIERVIDFSVEEIMDLRGIDLSNISNENLATLKNVSNAFKLGKIRKILEMARKNENK